MFFIGPSVNIFVYLLVSAFFVICFYSRTEAMPPEPLPEEKRIIEYRIGKNEIYCCQVTEDKNVVSPKGISFQQRINDRAEPDQYTYIVDYNDPNLISVILRAPPVI